MVEFITGGSGSGKTTLMFERIKAGNSSKQIVLVPEQYSYEFDKSLYFYLGSVEFNKLISTSFTGIARQLFQDFGEPDRKGEYADEYARMILIYQAVSAVRKKPEQFSFFRRQSTHNGFAEEVLDLINDMKRSGITPDTLRSSAIFAEKKLSDKTNDIADVYYEYERLMQEYGFKDNFENIRVAAHIANLHQYFKGKNVYIDEFESFTGDQIDMIKIIISSAANTVITLRTDNPYAGDFTLFETVNRTFRTIASICRNENIEYKVTKCGKSKRFRHDDLEYISEHIMRNFKAQPKNAPKPQNFHIFEARDMYSEVDYVCATIKRLIHDDKNLKYGDIAVLSNNIQPYEGILKAAFERYDIPFFMSTEKSAVNTPLMVFFTTLLDILSAKKLHSEQIFKMIKCGISGISLEDAAILENYCYKWGVDGDMWLSPFKAKDDDLELIEKMRENIITPVYKLRKKVRKDSSAEEYCRYLYAYLVECNIERNIASLMLKLIRENKDYAASEIKKLWSCLMDIFDSIVSVIGEKEISFAELSRIIRSMTAGLKYSVPPQTIDSVIAASARTARLNAPKILFAMGSTEGDFPNQVSLHGLFSELDKEKLSEKGIEISRPLSDLIASERLIVYKTLSTASEKLYISYPLSDLSGQAKYPSQVIGDIINMFDCEDKVITEDNVTPDYYAVTLHSAFYRYMQDFRRNDGCIAAIEKILTSDKNYNSRIGRIINRSEFSQDYKVDRSVMEKLKRFDPLYISPTALENYNRCHFMYFCSSILKLRTYEKVDIDVRIAGDIVHECFRGILAPRTKEEFISLSYEQISDEIKKNAEKYRDKNLAGEFGKTARFNFIFKKLTDGISNVMIHTQNSLMASDFKPMAHEIAIKDEKSVTLPFGKGNILRFSGQIDRADECIIDDKKYMRIVDYKSSKKEINSEKLASGLNMQMLLYLFAAADTGGIYDGYTPAGVLYTPIRIKELDLADSKDKSFNQSEVNSKLKTTGIILGDKKIINAMEKGGGGNYIPAKLCKNGSIDKKSSCISSEGMQKLKEYTYGKLVEMAESLLSGDVSADPLKEKKDFPCDFCGYMDICGNVDLRNPRTPDEDEVRKVQEILDMKE